MDNWLSKSVKVKDYKTFRTHVNKVPAHLNRLPLSKNCVDQSSSINQLPHLWNWS